MFAEKNHAGVKWVLFLFSFPRAKPRGRFVNANILQNKTLATTENRQNSAACVRVFDGCDTTSVEVYHIFFPPFFSPSACHSFPHVPHPPTKQRAAARCTAKLFPLPLFFHFL